MMEVARCMIRVVLPDPKVYAFDFEPPSLMSVARAAARATSISIRRATSRRKVNIHLPRLHSTATFTHQAPKGQSLPRTSTVLC